MEVIKVKKILIGSISKILLMIALIVGASIGIVVGLITVPAFTVVSTNDSQVISNFDFTGFISGLLSMTMLMILQCLLIAIGIIFVLRIFHYICMKSGGIEIEVERKSN